MYRIVRPKYADAVNTWTNHYTRIDIKGRSLANIAFSPHTGNIYVAEWYGGVIVLNRNGNVTKKSINNAGLHSVAVDYSAPKVYIGTDVGLKIYDEKSDTITDVTEVGYGIYKLFVPMNSRELFGVDTGLSDAVYRYRNNMFDERLRIKNIRIHHDHYTVFVVDGKGNYFYTTREYGRDVTKVQYREESSAQKYDDGPFFGLSVDNRGRVFGFVGSSVYHLNTNGKAQLVSTLDFTPTHMCFDGKNNAVFTTDDNNVVIMLDKTVNIDRIIYRQYDGRCLSNDQN